MFFFFLDKEKALLLFAFQMKTDFFQAAHPLWYIPCDGGLLQLAVLTFYPNSMPYESLSFYGQFTKYLAFHCHTLLWFVFWISIFLHVFEAGLAVRICRQLKMSSSTTWKWFIQTFLLGYPSLGKLKAYAQKNQ